jgi:hypothetical protein
VSAVFDRSTRKLAVTIPLAPPPAETDPPAALVTPHAPNEDADSDPAAEPAPTAARTPEAVQPDAAASPAASLRPPPPTVSFHQDSATLTAVVQAAGTVEGRVIERSVGPVTVHSYVLTLTPASGLARKLQLECVRGISLFVASIHFRHLCLCPCPHLVAQLRRSRGPRALQLQRQPG